MDPLHRSQGSAVSRRVGPGADFVRLKFGGGLHTRASEKDINEREASGGQNFSLDQENHQLRNRKPFDLLDTAGNAGSINGFINLVKADGTVLLAVQAGDTVYSYSGGALGSSIGTVSASAKLRGTLQSQWTLDDKVLISDLALQQQMMEWNGTTFTTMTEDLTGAFKARYCFVSGERAFFANVESNSVATPHLIAASTVEDYSALNISQKPSTSLGDGDPFYLLTPDLKPVNGIVEAFGVTAFSSKMGSVYYLTGSTSKDYAISDLYPRSAAVGDEAFTFVGNDIVYGRQGRIETVVSTDRFGNVQADDITVPIADQVKAVGDWTLVYNDRLQRIYAYDENGALYVFDKNFALAQQGISPWSKWVTSHSTNFQPTAVQNCLDPDDGLEYVFFGDASGNVYRMEGTGSAGDGGSAGITTEFLSKTFQAEVDADIYNVTGYLSYRAGSANTVTLSFEWSGEHVFDESLTISLPAVGYTTVFGGSAYFGGAYYFGTQFEGRLTRQKFGVAGRSNEMQCRVTVTGTADFEIDEIGLKFEVAAAKP